MIASKILKSNIYKREETPEKKTLVAKYNCYSSEFYFSFL